MDSIIDEICDHLSNMDLDIRKTKFSRFTDQKNTNDVISFIADCIVNHIGSDPNKKFTVKDIWNSDYFIKHVMYLYNKPNPQHAGARNEYNKFIGQPMRMFDYARILCSEQTGRGYSYKCNKLRFLQYIAGNERRAHNFLYIYLYRVMHDSGFLQRLESFRNNNTEAEFVELKKAFQKLIRGHTNIGGDLEINRIFPKVLNVFAVEWGIKGTKKGKLSSNIFYFSDLSYNEINFRDRHKPKGIPRKSSDNSQYDRLRNNYDYQTQKAKSIIKRIHSESEIKDKWSSGEATHIHHIFPNSVYPEFSADVENLIRLTPTQHCTKAHPKNKTREVDQSYQNDLIIAKSISIEKSLQNHEPYYSKERFIEILNKCLDLSIREDAPFDVIRRETRALLD